MAKKSETGRPVLVTTQHRGVFFGYLMGEPSKEKVLLERARNVVYWSVDVRGFLGLAEKGPTSGCRIGPATPSLIVFDVTAVAECTADAVKAFEAAPWSR